MQFLHSMIRVENLEKSLHFFCHQLGFQEVRRMDNDKGRFTLVFLAAPGDLPEAQEKKAPLIEITYNWPPEGGEAESLSVGRGFGHLAYRVENIYETCQSLVEKGVDILRPPRDGYMAFVKSPDGISIELLQANGPLEPQEPWVSLPNKGTW